MRNASKHARYFILSALLASCGRTQNTANVKHEAGNLLVTSSNSLQWVTLSDKEILEKGNSEIFDSPLELDHVSTKRTQFWLDALDSVARADNPNFKDVPRPRALLIKTPVENAGVSAVTVCVPANTENRVGAPRSEDDGVLALGVAPDGELMPMAESSCVMRPELAPRIAELVALTNQNLIEGCSVKFENGVIVIQGEKCKDDGHGARKASHFAFVAQANVVGVNTGELIANEDESHFVAILAHELGHYYRLHNITNENGYNYAYRATSDNAGHRPTADTSANEMLDRARAAQWPNATEFPGQKYASMLYSSLSGLRTSSKRGLFMNEVIAEQCKQGSACALPCSKYMAMTDRGGDNKFGQLSVEPIAFGTLSYAEIEPILAFESAFETCAKEIAIGEGVFSTADLNEMMMVSKYASMMKPIDVATHKTLFAYATEVSTQVRGMRVEAGRIFAELINNKVGFYTKEQEADEISAELLAKVGLPPERAIEGKINMSVRLESNLTEEQKMNNGVTQRITGEDCRSLYHNGWKGTDGLAAFVPVGDLQDSHHSMCFRTYNLELEIARHKYEVKNVGKFVPQHSWAFIREETKKVTPSEGGLPF